MSFCAAKILRWAVFLGMATATVSLVKAIPAQGVKVQTAPLHDWPAGLSPREVGERVAYHFVTSPHQYTVSLHYSEAAAWYGALQFARATGDAKLTDALVKRFEPIMPGGAESNRIPTRRFVDDSVFGIVPMEIARATSSPTYLAFGKSFADNQWSDPRPDGLTSESRFWIDDMYMITVLQVEAYRATHEMKYLDRAAEEVSAYLPKLQQPNGLFHHSVDVPVYWGRGDGWVAAGMTELLSELPENHPQRAFILKGYRAMMAGLLRYQGKDGMWNQLIDRDDAWPETSSTGMFAFAMVTGVKRGWLDAEIYGNAARRAWIGLAGYVDQNADVTNVCEGTDKKNDIDYYLARKRRTGDFHGQAPFLWTATALLAP